MDVKSKMKIQVFATFVTMIILIKDTTAYSTGAPTRACADMTPGHGFQVQTSPAPFLVEVSKTQYAPNERIYVRIRACGLSRFKGFIIQPRSAVYPERPAFLGAFLRVQGTRYECVRSGAVLTHSSPNEKQSVTMTWIAPPAAAGHVVFRVTVVQDYRNYWVGINSPVIYDSVSRDLTMMQAFILQSPTDQSCLPGRTSATSTTETIPETTTKDLTLETTTVIQPTTTTAMPTTTTTTTPTTTTTRPTTRRPTTARPTVASTRAPKTTMPLPTDMFYDYIWDITTDIPKTKTTEAPKTTTTTSTTQLPTTTTTTVATTTTTTPKPTTTEYIPPIITFTEAFEPTTTTMLPETTTFKETTTEQPTTVASTTTTTLPPPTTVSTTTTTTISPTTTTTTTMRPTTTTRTTTTTAPPVTTESRITTEDFFTTSSAATTTTMKPTTTTLLPTTVKIITTTRELPSPTTTILPPRQSTAVLPAMTTTTTSPRPTTIMTFQRSRSTEPLPGTTPVGLRAQFTRVLGEITTAYRPPQTRTQDSTTYFPDYFDPNRADSVPSSFYDYGGFNKPDSAVVTNDRPRVDKDISTTEWVPTRRWTMPSQRTTPTVIPTETNNNIFNPPETPAITRARLPASTTTVYVPTTTVTMPSVTTTTTIKVPEIMLTPDPACGVTQGCFDDCSNGVCNYIVTWVPEKDKIVFEIRTKPRTPGQYWAAIGFSDDKMMGLDSVTECITEGEQINVYQSYNLDYYRNMRLLTPTLGIVDQSGYYRDGIFQCKFTRENFVAGEKDVFDLSKDWYMMFAEGPAVNGIKIPHRYDVIPPVSRDRIDLQQYPPVHETYDYRLAHVEETRIINVTDEPVLPTSGRRIALDEECGSSHSCFQECSPAGCHFIVSWKSHDDYVTFRTRAEVNETQNIWIAIAFSDDKFMGDDSVIQCVANGNGEIDIRHSFNNGKNNVRIENSDIGLRNTSASLRDGVFECEFVRQRHVGDYEHIFNLDRKWNILFAHGKSKKGIMLPHSLDHRPHVSDSPVDFRESAPSHITASTFFIKIHASVMIFAWILCASVASVVGRYFQPYWWGEKMLGSKVWIKVHWLFVLLTCSAVIAGFTVIFVGVGGISKLYEHPESGFNGTHPIMGLIVTLLALLNPLLLCLKPSEDSSGRAFFNCLYWLVEIGAHVLAVVTIYAGFGLTSDFVPHFFTFMLIGFTVYQILVLLFMEALKSFDAKKTIEKKKIYLYEMQIRPWHARKNNSLAAYMDLNHTSKGLKQTVFATHLILLSALTTTMLVLIITGYH